MLISAKLALLLAAAPLTYDDVAPIIADNCQFCHTGGPENGTAGISLDTEAEVVAQAKLIYAAVSSGLMPYGDDTWHLTADGLKLLEYVKAQIPAEPTPLPTPTPTATPAAVH